MYCLRCGKDAPDKHVFCETCLASMEKYPIKPGTSVHLPRKKEAPVVKKTSRRLRSMTAEELVVRMRRALRVMTVLLVISLLLLCVAVGLLLNQHQNPQNAVIGQNYTVTTGK